MVTKYKPYPAYKDSGISWLGEVPAGWEVKRLRFVAHLNPSRSEAAAIDRNTEVSFLPMEAIGDDGSLNLERTRPVGEVESGYTYFREGDVTIAKITPCFENGKGAIMRGLWGGIGFGTTELIVVRPQVNKTTSVYLHWLFLSTPFRKLGEASMYGAGGQKRVPDDFIRNFTTAFPPLPEQQTIATFLDRETAKIDTLIAKQEHLIELLQEKRTALISHAATKGLNPDAPMKDSGVEWLGEVPGHWEVRRLKHNFRLLTQKTDRRENPVALENIQSWLGRFIPTETEFEGEGITFERGDILFGKLRPYLAKAFLAETAGEAVGDFFVMRSTSDINGRFALYQILNKEFISIVDGSTFGAKMPRVSWEFMSGMVLAMPTKDEQSAIAAFLDRETAKIDTLIQKSRYAIDLLKERRTALISAAVTGKIDVR